MVSGTYSACLWLEFVHQYNMATKRCKDHILIIFCLAILIYGLFSCGTATDYFVQNICKIISQGGRGTKIHVQLPYRGAISFYAYILPLGLINIFLHVERDKITSGLQPTRFP